MNTMFNFVFHSVVFCGVFVYIDDPDSLYSQLDSRRRKKRGFFNDVLGNY